MSFKHKLLSACVGLALLFAFIQPTSRISSNFHDPKEESRDNLAKGPDSSAHYLPPDPGAISVAIISPFRDIHAAQNRASHLARFVPYMDNFLMTQLKLGHLLDYHIYIIEQSDDGRKFNRGKLLNIGFDLATKNNDFRTQNANDRTVHVPIPPHDVVIFHDIDLMPGDDLAPYYTKFPSSPIHIAKVWERYKAIEKYFGGIVSVSVSDFKRINGFPNTLWGWVRYIAVSHEFRSSLPLTLHKCMDVIRSKI